MKTSTHLGVSQEFRLMIAIFIFSLGGWVWFNFFMQPKAENTVEFELYRMDQNDNYPQPIRLLDGGSKANLVLNNVFDKSSLPPASLDSSYPFTSGSIQLVQANVSDSEENTGEIYILPSLALDEETEAPVEEDGTTVTPVVPPRVVREIEVLELPFLVTEPPAPEPEAEDTVPTSRAARPRSSVNPFAPIVVAAAPPSPRPATAPPPRASTSSAQPPASPTRVDNTTTRSTTQLPPDVVPPTPRSVIPPSPKTSASRLPQALPSGTLPVSPALLSRPTYPAAGTHTAHTPLEVDITQIVGARTPSTTPLSTPPPISNTVSSDTISSTSSDLPSNSNVASTPTSATSDSGQAEIVVPAPISLSAASSRSFGIESQAPQTSVVPGITALSRYLRDTNLSFTGAVLGPVSLAVFRANEQSFSVQLGQNLPDTDIILTDVKNHEVELTQGNESQLLILDLRR